MTALLRGGNVDPVKGSLRHIHAGALRHRLTGRPLVSRIRYCGAPDNGLYVRIARHVPVLHIVDTGNRGCCLSGGNAIVPPSTGYITRLTIMAKGMRGSFTVESLCGFNMFLRGGSF